MKNKKNNGFTLIELMITVAIIGILAGIAIPTYQLYTTRTKITEVFSLSSNLKPFLSEYHYFNTEMPEDTNAIINDATTGMENASDIISAATYNKIGANIATLTVALDNIGNTVNGQTIVITYLTTNGTLTLTCSDGTLEQRYRPSACRN